MEGAPIGLKTNRPNNSIVALLAMLTLAECLGFSQIPVLAAHKYKADYSDKLLMTGLTWFNFGPAIINSCKSMVLIDYGDRLNPSRRFVIGEKDKYFKKLRDKISARYENWLNYSPEDNGFDVRAANCLYLFCSPTPPESERADNGAPLLWQHGLKNPELRSTYLLGIPLENSLRHGKQVEQDIKELESLMHEDKTARPGEEGKYGGEYRSGSN